MATEGSSAVVLNEDHEILLVLRQDTRIWALPGGGRETGETCEQTAVREVREETGYDVKLERLVGEYWRPRYPNGGDRMRVFKARVLGGDPSEHDWESLDVRWFPLNKLPKILWPLAREHIQDTLANSKEPMRKEQTLSGIWAVLMMLKACFVIFRQVHNRIRHRR
jgi:8-oxo-dGTP pyrophosphatase MutT (NUDIX family)